MPPTDKILIMAVLVLLYHPSQVTFASAPQCKEATHSISNRVLAGHAFLTKHSPNIEDCVMSCIARDPLCESTNYYRKTKVCELNDKTAESNPEDLVDFEWAIYMTNSVRLLPCNDFDSECGRQTDICQMKQGGNNCEACLGSLGMENGKIPSSAITASTRHSPPYAPDRARLNSPTSWSVSDQPGPQSWLQVDLGRVMAVKKVATQGRRNYPNWVISYKISSSVDGIDLVLYAENGTVKVFQGNSDQDTVVSQVFSQHIRARFIRILPQTWFRRVSMRIELYGCSIECSRLQFK